VTDPTSTLPIIAHARRHAERSAAIDAHGASTYNELLEASQRVAAALLTGRDDLREARIAFLLPPGVPWIATLWGIWQAGGIAVPLPISSARPELEYFIENSDRRGLWYRHIAI
jgi:malonyl-CoA/methylmalonyl-CoA synthetase